MQTLRLLFLVFLTCSSLHAESATEILDRLDTLPVYGRYREVIKVKVTEDQADPLLDEIMVRLKDPHPEMKRAISFYSSVFGVLCESNETLRKSLLRYHDDFFAMVKTPLPSSGKPYERAQNIRMAAFQAFRYLPLDDTAELENLLYDLFLRMEDGQEFLSLRLGMSNVLFTRRDWSDTFKKRVRQFVLEVEPCPQLPQIYLTVQTCLLRPTFDVELFDRLHALYSDDHKFRNIVAGVLPHALPKDLSENADLSAAFKAWMLDEKGQPEVRFEYALLLHEQDPATCEKVFRKLLNDEKLKDHTRSSWARKLRKQSLEHLVPEQNDPAKEK